MKKYRVIVLTLVALAVLVVVAACAAVPSSPTAAPTSAPVAEATAAVATPAAPVTGTLETAGTPAADRPIVPAPQEGQRPLAQQEPAAREDAFSGPAEQYVKENTVYIATIVTDKGNIVAELYQDTPESLNNFVTLALNGFYDGLTFHRVEDGFVVQGGDPAGTGQGGPGYDIPAEIKHNHPRGALAWARTGDEVNPERRSSGSQFYIVTGDASFLNGMYTVFGYVTEGMDVVDKIAVGDKIQRIDITTADVTKLPTDAPSPTPTMTPTPFAPTAQEGRPLATVTVAERQSYYNSAPEMTIDANKTYQATIETDKGTIVVDLDPKAAPKTVNNFVLLANLGFYDGMPVAYVEPETYLVLGSPASQPGSDVGYLLDPEAATNGSVESSQVVTGTVAMYPIAISQTDVKASGSQFFISLTELPPGNTPLSIFGKVSSGADVVTKLAAGDVVKSITITEK